MKNKVLLVLAFIGLSFGVKAQTTIPALITSNQVWDVSGSPYLLGQNSYIDTGVSVTVMPGVEIKSSGMYKLDVHGEFQALGKWDSVIKISKVMFRFSAKSRDYNANTGRGAYFNYCNIEGNGSGYMTMELTSTAIKIDHCVFVNSYYSIYLYGSFPYETTLTELTNSEFSGDSYGNGSPIYCSNMNSKLWVKNCLFRNSDNIYTYGNIVFTNNAFVKMRKINFNYMNGMNEVSCNRFNNIKEGVTVDASWYNTITNLVFNDNTLDSFGTTSGFSDHMFTLKRKPSNSTIKDSIEIKDNNFLSFKGTVAKVAISGSNYTPTKTDTVNLQSNYWGANDATVIEGYIKDYKDDINIYGRADFSSFRNAPVIGCSYNGGCAIANFTYSASDSVITFYDSSYSTKAYKVKWKFGDGSTNDSNLQSVTHHYNPGMYMACMYTYDTLGNLCDSMCKTVRIFSNAVCRASYYFAIDTSNLNIVYVVNTSFGINTQTKYYWTFGDGTGSMASNPTHTYTSDGKYQLCLTIYDTLINCYSTYCDSIEINSAGTSLQVLNSNQVGITQSGLVGSMTVFPNPSQGSLKISLNSIPADDVLIEVMNASGQVVRSAHFDARAGFHEMNFDLSDCENGLYCINIRSGGFSKTVKLILDK